MIKKHFISLLHEELTKRETGLGEEEFTQFVDEIYEAIRDLEEELRDELDGLAVRVTTLEEKTAAMEEKDEAREAAIAAERFLLVRLGESIAPSFDREILRAAPAGG